MKILYRTFLLALVLCLLTCTTHAAPPQFYELTPDGLHTTSLLPCAGYLQKTVPKYQTYSREITIYRQVDENTFVPTPLIVPMVLITYQYTIEWGLASRKILGGRFDIHNYPTVDDSIADPVYGVSAQKYLSPPIYDVDPTNNGATYLVDVRGGSFTLTYNSSLYYNMHGELLDDRTVTSTTRIAFYFNHTGTWDNP